MSPSHQTLTSKHTKIQRSCVWSKGVDYESQWVFVGERDISRCSSNALSPPRLLYVSHSPRGVFGDTHQICAALPLRHQQHIAVLNIWGVGFGEDWQDWAEQPCFISFSTITDHFCVLCPKISFNLSIWQHLVRFPNSLEGRGTWLGNTSFQQCLWFESCQRGTNINWCKVIGKGQKSFNFYSLLSILHSSQLYKTQL